MTKGRETDPELGRLLRAFREIHPDADEMERWRTAVAGEIRDLRAPPNSGASGASVAASVAAAAAPRGILRLIAEIAIPIAAAAGLGFVIGAAVVERRVDQGQAMLFSLTEPGARARPPATQDEEREVVHIDLDAGGVR